MIKWVFFIGFSMYSIVGISQNYTSYFTGNDQDAIVEDLEFSLTVMGGASEVDIAMKLFLEDAKGGDVLVLRASGSDGYNDYLYSELGVPVNSVETIVFHNREASTDEYVLNRILRAEAIWFAGGDQWDYLTYWSGTLVQQYINFAVLDRGMPVGGTSAGMAIMGSYQFTAENGTITSDQALSNPYDENMTISNIPFLILPIPGPILFDTHFDDPDRRGRMAAFLARIRAEYNQYALGLGLDEYTAARIKGSDITFINDSYNENQDFAHLYSYNCTQEPEEFSVESGQGLTWTDGHLKYARIQTNPSLDQSFDMTKNIPDDFEMKLFEVDILNGVYTQNEIFGNADFPKPCVYTHTDDGPKSEMYIVPNITQNNSISIHTNIEIRDIKLIDITGAEYNVGLSRINTGYNLNIDNLPSSHYFIKATTINGVMVKRFVKLK